MKAIKFVEFSVRNSLDDPARDDGINYILFCILIIIRRKCRLNMKQSIRKTYKQLKWLKKETKDRIEQIGCTPFTGTS